MDEILQHVNESSIRGELARELTGILSDYENGKISAQDKNDLLQGVIVGFQATEAASDEDTVRWLVQAANIVSAVV